MLLLFFQFPLGHLRGALLLAIEFLGMLKSSPFALPLEWDEQAKIALPGHACRYGFVEGI